MSDLFEEKNIKPMLIGIEAESFDSDDYIFELKLDGIRCLAYLDNEKTDIRNKRNIKLLSKVPELANIHSLVKKQCILDGEVTIIKNGKPDFFQIQKRSMLSNSIKIEIEAQRYPACFTAFDIIYYDGKSLIDLPLEKRKKLLQSVVKKETNEFAISRYIEYSGIAFYELAKQQGLEGIVAKKRGSKYYFDKRTANWKKIKFMLDDDFIVCGYINKANNIKSIVLGQYKDNVLVDKGHVTLGVNTNSFEKILKTEKIIKPDFLIKENNKNAIWIKLKLVCTVKYMNKTQTGNMRQPVFKALRDDKSVKDCIE